MSELLIVDDEPSICWGLRTLAGQLGHHALVASSAEEALALARSQPPDAILLDVRLPGIDGLTAIDHFRRLLGELPIVIMTAFGDLEIAVAAVRKGAFDYLVKPFDLDVAQRAIERALARHAPLPAPAAVPEGKIVGSSKAMQEVFKQIALVAPTEACVHIRGESGVGKELVARAIHEHSRRSGPFLAVNIAALSPALAESELFGHVRGAFTGADAPHAGFLERADGGTVFLDEVADIPPAIQVKLLRVLEYGEVLPVGASRPVRSDFRILSATHRDLVQKVAQGDFRHDLFYRLMTFAIEIPPLRDRPADVGELVEHFLDLLAAKNGVPRPTLAEEVRAELARRPWWGNVRELRNALEHAMILARGGPLLAEHLPPPMPRSDQIVPDRDEALAAAVRQWTEQILAQSPEAVELHQRLLGLVEPPLFESVLRRHGGQYLAAAKQLGLHRVTLKRRLDSQNPDAG